MDQKARAARIIQRCRELASITDVPGETTRLFLSPATKKAHERIAGWMHAAGLETSVDDIGNLRGMRRADSDDASTLLLFSHIDTVPNAGAFDGPLGVILGLEAIEALRDQSFPFNIEVIALSEEEGVRFAYPFLSSRAVTRTLPGEALHRADADGVTLADAIRAFGLRPEALAYTATLSTGTFAAIEVHIEQGPVLDAADEAIAIVSAIAGQSRLSLAIHGIANHAGTTPMTLRRDALVAAAELIVAIERCALDTPGLVATVGRIEARPGAMNVVPGNATLTLDIRHADDTVRQAAVSAILSQAQSICAARALRLESSLLSEQSAVPMEPILAGALTEASHQLGLHPRTMISGAGHDSMILAPAVPTAMLFIRSPEGISHNPAESVREADVDAALRVIVEFIAHARPAR